MTEDQPAIQSLRSHGKRLTLTLQTFGLALHVTVIASQWGHWSSVAILVSLWLAAAVGNVLIAAFVTLRRGHDRGENLRAAYNIVIHAAIVGMPRQISQAVLNLIVNALHALDPRGGHVWVTMVERDDAVVLAVKDDGAGMSSDTQKQLFQPFFTSKPVGKGLGLGLAVVYGIVQAHHGRIDVDSAPGHGTCFTITLPRLRGHAGAAQPEPARAADRLAS